MLLLLLLLLKPNVMRTKKTSFLGVRGRVVYEKLLLKEVQSLVKYG